MKTIYSLLLLYGFPHGKSDPNSIYMYLEPIFMQYSELTLLYLLFSWHYTKFNTIIKLKFRVSNEFQQIIHSIHTIALQLNLLLVLHFP